MAPKTGKDNHREAQEDNVHLVPHNSFNHVRLFYHVSMNLSNVSTPAYSQLHLFNNIYSYFTM